MSALLFQMANTMMNVMGNSTLLSSSTGSSNNYDELPAEYGWVTTVTNAIDVLLWPLLILVGSAGMIYAIYLGVNLARADSADKQQEAKKRLINAIIGLAVIIALILLLKLFVSYLPTWLNIEPAGPNDSPETGGVIGLLSMFLGG